MKKIILAVTVALTSLLTPSVLRAQAIPINDQHYWDLAGTTIRNQCTNERMTITSGSLLAVIHGVVSPKKFGFIWNDIGDITAVDGNGTVYHGIFINNFALQDNFKGSSFSMMQVINIVLTTPGGGNNSHYRLHVHKTVTPSGTVTVDVDEIIRECH